MKSYKNLLLPALLCLASVTTLQAREVTSFNQEWGFKKGVFTPWGVYPNIRIPQCDTLVNLPHTFNEHDIMSDEGYFRGEGSYMKHLEVPEAWKGKRIFLKFEGAAQVADVNVNFTHVLEHKGAYNAFAIELTDRVDYGKDNIITVTCNNAHRFDVAAQGGDYNVPGGLYRDVWLEVTDEDACISPLYFGSEGVLLHQRRVTEERADLMAEVHLLSKSGYKGCEVTVALLDAEGNTVISKTTPYINNDQAIINLAIDRPHLWNGTADPYLYTLVTTLSRNGKEIDRVEEQTGFRYFWVDADKGFFLNGKHIRLRGVSRHQEWKDVSAALTREHHLADYDLMSEMGINALRLAHYPQAHFMFEEADRRGILVWEEIPFICNYIKDSMDENLRFQLREMIIQNFNHPSIFCWGLFNEVPDDHCSMTAELNDIAHTLDPSRLTTAATCFEGDFNFITDLMGWNKYAGWYYGTFSDFATIFDTWHAEHPDVKLCISEYGAGAAISQHVGRYRESDGSDARESARGHWHPMEKQTASHMAHIRMIEERPYLWGTFVWNMFDFASSMRREGDTNNMNDKGLVSHDRKVRKDAFYAYKAYWNKNEKTVHLCSKDYTQRKEALCDIIVFTTAPSVKLYINGKLVGTQKTDAFATAQWRDFTLQKGENRVEVRTAHGNDSATWIVE